MNDVQFHATGSAAHGDTTTFQARRTSATAPGRSPARMTLRQLAGQLTSIDPGRYPQLAGEDIALPSPAARSAAPGWSATGCASCRRSRSRTAIRRSWSRTTGGGATTWSRPFRFYCFDMDLVRRAHEQAAVDAHLAGVTLIRITCDYAFAQNQGRTQEGRPDLLTRGS